jgi:metal-responsive CopG/Arc/MetJ family transcriptional regulator
MGSNSKMRINITIDKETLRLADRAARRRKVSRSEFIRTAVQTAAAGRERESEEDRRKERQQRAIETMNRLARKAGNWPAVEILHAWRYRLEGRKRKS